MKSVSMILILISSLCAGCTAIATDILHGMDDYAYCKRRCGGDEETQTQLCLDNCLRERRESRSERIEQTEKEIRQYHLEEEEQRQKRRFNLK